MEGRQGGGMNRGNSSQGGNRAQGGPGRGASGGNRSDMGTNRRAESGMNHRQEMNPNRHPEAGMNQRQGMNSNRHPETGMNRRPDINSGRHPETGMGEPRAPHRHGYRMPPFGLGCMGNMGYGDCVLVRDALFQLCHGYRVDPRTMHMVEMFFGRPIHPSEYGDVWRWMDEYVRGW